MVENNNLTGSAIESITALRYLYVGFGGRAELALRTWQALFPMDQCNYYMHASLFAQHAYCACLVQGTQQGCHAPFYRLEDPNLGEDPPNPSHLGTWSH